MVYLHAVIRYIILLAEEVSHTISRRCCSDSSFGILVPKYSLIRISETAHLHSGHTYIFPFNLIVGE
jgi:hypothetical protein